MAQKKIILVCNAHIDPVWLWEWEEGLAETLATFRTAAQLCEEFAEFVFCHNEALLYQWVEIYDPELFAKIKTLVKQGKWAIMGGWYVQPDCNLPTGESFVRQILHGKNYFLDKFGIEPRTAVNLDPFGHTRGLVQILKKAGYDSYLFCRPDVSSLELPEDDFIWIGYDGSEVFGHRVAQHYNSQRGLARQKVELWIKQHPDQHLGLLLWGIGNHGGGPSREDLKDLRELLGTDQEYRICHGRPEDYFDEKAKKLEKPKPFRQDLNPWSVGCYTTMSRLKTRYRKMENCYFLTEKMVTHAALAGLLEFPRKELQDALEDMLFCQFHDILPGSAIAEVEAYAMQRLDHGLEILERQKSRAFFALLSGQMQAQTGEFPIMVYNPHPYAVHETIVCEFQPPEPNFNRDVWMQPELFDAQGQELPHQVEKESCNISVDQRKRVVFSAQLEPGQINRFSLQLKPARDKPDPVSPVTKSLHLCSPEAEVIINPDTGWIDKYTVTGVDYLNQESLRLRVCKDYPDPWGMKVNAFRELIGHFELMSSARSAEFAGVQGKNLHPVRIIEDGPVRSVVEALFQYQSSSACIHYIVPKIGNEVEVQIRVYWNEKDCMLKLSIPTSFSKGSCWGQVAYGVEEVLRPDDEQIAQKWVAVLSEDQSHALTVINSGTYGFDFQAGELRPSLLRSAAYAAHPVADDTPIVAQNRFVPRIDQGENFFRFWIQGGESQGRLDNIDREAQVKNETLPVLCCYPIGKSKSPQPVALLKDKAVQMPAIKISEDGQHLILRLFEPTGTPRSARIEIPVLDLKFEIDLNAFEVKTLTINLGSKEVMEADLLERPLEVLPG